MRPLWLSVAFLAGIILASILTLQISAWLVLSAVAMLLGLLSSLSDRFDVQIPLAGLIGKIQTIPLVPIPFPWLVMVVLLGGARYQVSQPEFDPGFIGWYNDLEMQVIVEGVLFEPGDERDAFTHIRLNAESLRFDESLPAVPVKGRMLARVKPGSEWRYGDRVKLSGYLETPPTAEDFSYRDYLAHHGVYTYMPRADATLLVRGEGNPVLRGVYALKAKALSMVYRLYPDPEASLLAGILLGVESGIPKHVQDDFKDTGTAHIIAISGFNVTIIAGLFVVLFSRAFGKRWGALAAGVGIAGYTVLVGADPAVVRAAIMGGISLLARQVGRRQDGLNSLGVSAALMAVFNPGILWDVGFQLSFAATLGLVLYAEPFSGEFIRAASRLIPQISAQKLADPFGEYVLFTLAAQLTTLPVTVYHFKRLSLTSLVANPAILPAQPPVMVMGGLGVILGLIHQLLGQAAAALAWPFVVYTIRVVEFFGRMEGGVVVLGNASLISVVLFYTVLFGITARPQVVKRVAGGVKLSVVAASLGVLAVLAWRSALSAPDGLLHLTVLDVSGGSQSGDALLIQTPQGRFVLINGGPSASRLSDGLGRRLPLFHRKLDYLVVAAPREEQVAALPRAIERYPPGEVLWAGSQTVSRSARYLAQALSEREIPVTTLEAGHRLELGSGARLEVLAAGKRGAILLLVWGNYRALLPFGVGFNQLEDFHYGRDIGPVTALLLADNGYAPVNPPEWIDQLRPHVVLLSVAAGDPDGLPSPETIEALEGYPLLRTDRHGWIHLSSDGKGLWVEVKRR